MCCSIFSQDIRANFTSPVARFAVSNLHPGSVYIISIYAFNSKGRSDPAVLPAAMLRPAEKQLTAEKGKKYYKDDVHTIPPLPTSPISP